MATPSKTPLPAQPPASPGESSSAAVAGWHFHRWTAWYNIQLTTTDLRTGNTSGEAGQGRHCTRCLKRKARRVPVK